MKPEYHAKGWGYELWIHNDEEYCGKLLFFKEGKRCSLHYHEKKLETFYLQSGKMILRYGDVIDEIQETLLTPGDSFEVYRGLIHQMIALEDDEWKQERTRMITHISEVIIKDMSDEQKENYVRSCIVERYYYAPDHEVVDKYENLGGEWTDKLEEYRPQPKSQMRMSGTMRDEIRLTR